MSHTTLDLGSWCILRMNSGDTLRVVEALMEQGLSVWTPVDWCVGRMPRTRARYDKAIPVLPGYAFGDVGHIDELVRLAGLRRRDFPKFRFLESERGAELTPLIADSELDWLRAEDARLRAVFDRHKRKEAEAKAPKLEAGTPVKMTDGAYAGLSGVVEGSCGQDSMVHLPAFKKTVKVASLLLLPSVAQDGLPLDQAA